MGKNLKPKNQAEFSEIIAIIEQARENAFRAVNHELISMYWKVGECASSTKPTVTMKNSRHWCEKLTGRTTL